MKLLTMIGCGLGLISCAVSAQVKVGLTLPQTGPAAMLGLGATKALELYPKKIGDFNVEYTLLDDASDTTAAVTNAKKLISEQNVDVVIGSATTPQCLAMLGVVAEGKTPMICLGSGTAVTEPVDAKRRWVFKVPPSDSVYVESMVAHLAAAGGKKVAFIGFNDAYGEGMLKAFNDMTAKYKLNVVAVERYARTDTSVIAQVLKVMAQQPDAVMIAAAGTPGALPTITLRERGYKGSIYLNAPVATKEFFQTAGTAADGALIVVNVGLVVEQVPDSNPLKRVNLDFKAKYDAKFGAGNGNLFAVQDYDAIRFLEKAIPIAAAKAKPGSKEFRSALRDAIESFKEFTGNTGIYNFSVADHSGLDLRAVVIARVAKGQLTYVPK